MIAPIACSGRHRPADRAHPAHRRFGETVTRQAEVTDPEPRCADAGRGLRAPRAGDRAPPVLTARPPYGPRVPDGQRRRRMFALPPGCLGRYSHDQNRVPAVAPRDDRIASSLDRKEATSQPRPCAAPMIPRSARTPACGRYQGAGRRRGTDVARVCGTWNRWPAPGADPAHLPREDLDDRVARTPSRRTSRPAQAGLCPGAVPPWADSATCDQLQHHRS